MPGAIRSWLDNEDRREIPARSRALLLTSLSFMGLEVKRRRMPEEPRSVLNAIGGRFLSSEEELRGK